jgi:mannan endo-1,4-beta-mannosidase
MNEIDLGWGATSDEIYGYIDEMAAFVRDYETERWGRTRLITVSSAEALPDGQLGGIIYQHPALDFANTHLYIGDITDPIDPMIPGTTMAGGVVLSLDEIEDDRPYFDSESGPIANWIVDPQFDREYHHNMSWGHLAACGAGSGMRWPYTTPHYILPEMRDNLLGLARVTSTIDWAHFDSENITRQVTVSDRAIIRVGCSDGETALIWLLADRRADQDMQIPGKTLMLADVLCDGEYSVEYWETYSGDLLGTETVRVENDCVELTIPEFDVDLRDLAIIIRALAAQPGRLQDKSEPDNH